IHETGHQMMQTGYLFRSGREFPHYGAALSYLKGRRVEGVPPFVVLPSAIGNTGVSVSHGQEAGFLGAKHEPHVLDGKQANHRSPVTDFTAAECVDPARLKTRKALLEAVDQAHGAFDASEESRAPDSPHAQVFGGLFAKQAKLGFDIAAE